MLVPMGPGQDCEAHAETSAAVSSLLLVLMLPSLGMSTHGAVTSPIVQ